MDEYDRRHLLRIAAIARMVERIYDAVAKDAAGIGAMAVRQGADGEKPFSFDDYPQAEERMDELLAWMRGQLEAVVGGGVVDEWLLSEDKNDSLVQRILDITGTDSEALPDPVRRRWFDRNEKGCESFLKRKEKGMGLSQRVWRATASVPSEIAMGIDMGIRDGKPAAAMARDLKQYLKFPDKLFRRVRDERGILHLSKNAAAFHPGQGVYRSSYQNARRLAVTETNMAYRTADHERWQNLDFVVGIEIHLSGNHTCKGRDGKPHRFTDICDQLKGKYPKDFKFTGWHPHCRCYATSIIKTEEELDEDMEKILGGKPTDGESVRKVDDVPENFKDWTEKNEKRIAAAEKNGTLPGFVRENEERVSGVKDEARTSNTLIKAAPGKPEQKRVRDTMNIDDFNLISTFPNGGKVLIHNLVSSSDSDYNKLVGVAAFFAKMGKEVRLTPKMKRPKEFDYASIYSSLIGTKYEDKCPDMLVDDNWYEHEGFITDNARRAFSNMMNHGLKQCPRLVIDKPNLTDGFMIRSCYGRINNGADIQEVWLRGNDGSIRLLFESPK